MVYLFYQIILRKRE